MSDDGLRAAYVRALATREPAQRAACPSPDAILAVVRRAGREDERLAVLDHVMACPACRNEFELLRAIERAGEQAVAAEAKAPGRVVGHIRWRQWAPLAAAAAILLAVALGPGRSLWQRPAEPVRGGGVALGLIAPAEAAAPTGSAVAFLWHSVPGAEGYTLELLTSGGQVALSRTTADTALTVALPPTMPPGDYTWWVSSRTAAGSGLRSGMRTLRLRGR